MIKLALVIEGLDAPEDVIGLTPEKIDRAAWRAINFTAERIRTLAAKEIIKQVNFPASYLTPAKGNLTIPRTAGPNALEAVISARHRATSLARFSVGGTPGKMGVDVSVKPGSKVHMARGFLMKLRSGKSDIDTAHNLGLAVRTDKGKAPDAAYKPVRIADGLYLLYGPSVNQIFRTVREDLQGEAFKLLATEYMRLLDYERTR